MKRRVKPAIDPVRFLIRQKEGAILQKVLDAILYNSILAYFVRSKNTQRNVIKRGIHDSKPGRLWDYFLPAKNAMNDPCLLFASYNKEDILIQ